MLFSPARPSRPPQGAAAPARRHNFSSRRKWPMDLRLILLRINEIAITGVSGEVLTNIYYRLKKESPFTHTIMVTIANDRLGCIADDANWDRVSNATLARGCAENAIVDNLIEMMIASIQ